MDRWVDGWMVGRNIALSENVKKGKCLVNDPAKLDRPNFCLRHQTKIHSTFTSKECTQAFSVTNVLKCKVRIYHSFGLSQREEGRPKQQMGKCVRPEHYGICPSKNTMISVVLTWDS